MTTIVARDICRDTKCQYKKKTEMCVCMYVFVYKALIEKGSHEAPRGFAHKEGASWSTLGA